MKIPALFTLLVLQAHFSIAQHQLRTPAEFLGYEPGKRFSSHHRVVEYFEHVASVLPNAEVFHYGKTYEDRPLLYLAITSPENFKQLENIRTDNLKRTGLAEGNPTGKKIAIENTSSFHPPCFASPFLRCPTSIAHTCGIFRL